jgi:hypothetical protein
MKVKSEPRARVWIDKTPYSAGHWCVIKQQDSDIEYAFLAPIQEALNACEDIGVGDNVELSRESYDKLVKLINE